MNTRFIMTVLVFLFLFFAPSLSFGEEKNGCIVCHSELSDNLVIPVQQWKESVHSRAGVECQDCHGGNPRSMDMAESMNRAKGFKGRPSAIEIPQLCGGCHSDVRKMRQYNLRTDQLAEYKTSIHGKRLFEKKDPNVATCISCHGTHDIKKKDDPRSRVYKTNVPEMCGSCHSNKEKMKGYKIPTNQLDEYMESHHAKVLYGKIPGKNPMLAPNCADCHGIHGATPPGVDEVVNVCGNCHSVTQGYFKEGPHFAAMKRVGVPKCINCHGNHKIEFPSISMFSNGDKGICKNCHEEKSLQIERSKEIYTLLVNLENQIKEAEKGLKEAEASGKYLEDLYLKLREAKDKLIEAGPVSHSLNVAKIKLLAEEATDITKKINSDVNEIRKELSMRKNTWLVIAGLTLFTAFLIGVKLYMIEKG
ncbi:MAG: cytochrome c3 family protein [Candidatus Aenigmatarchaeota archaeon]